MTIHVNKNSEIPVHEQIATQIVFLIGTGKLKPGMLLPSVRALAQRLGVHRNTVSRAYHSTILNKLVEKRQGARLAVRAPSPEPPSEPADLDDVLNVAIREARRCGCSVHQLHTRLAQRIAATPPDRLLVLSEDPGMRKLFPKELERVGYRVDACTPGELLSRPELGDGALVVSPQGHIPSIRSVLPRDRPAIPIKYTAGDAYLESIRRRLTTPSVIAVVSVSAYFLEMACGVLTTILEPEHSMNGYLMTGRRATWPRTADVVVCDVLTYPIVCGIQKTGMIFAYKLISDDCADTVAAAMER